MQSVCELILDYVEAKSFPNKPTLDVAIDIGWTLMYYICYSFEIASHKKRI